ncbi:hypothetical protein, partial [Enterococcus faecium]|uniref:hypothetical protein n=1 Tax=Enterococcus faecium TaxID=1352 RepID=UPI002930491D
MGRRSWVCEININIIRITYGVFVDDPALLEVLDHSLEAKEQSLIYPVKKNAKDEYQKGSF